MSEPPPFDDIPNPGAGRGRKRGTNGGNPDGHQLPIIEWFDEQLSDWAGRDIPDRLWVVPDWIPRGQVTGLYGIGGINKTDFLIQLGLAKSKGKLPFIGYMLEAGPVYALFLEDTREEIVRRASRIAKKAWGFDSLADFPDLHFVSLVGYDDPEFVSFNGTAMEIKQALYLVDQKIEEIGAHLVLLDTLPHFFGGNEIVRREVSRFIRKLDGISIARQCGMLFSAHPSAQGRRSGTMESGSTGWEGGMRARLGLHDPGLEGNPDDPQAPRIASDRRILTRIKSNYAKPGETIELVLRDGTFFIPEVGPEAANRPPKSGPGRNEACDMKFLELLAAVTRQGRYVSNNAHSGHWAPKAFYASPDGQEFSLAEYKRAMERLFGTGRIIMGSHGHPPSKATRCIIGVQAQPAPVEPEPAAPEPPPEPPSETAIQAKINELADMTDAAFVALDRVTLAAWCRCKPGELLELRRRAQTAKAKAAKAAQDAAQAQTATPPPAPASEAQIEAAVADYLKLDEGKRALQRAPLSNRLFGPKKLNVFDAHVKAQMAKAAREEPPPPKAPPKKRAPKTPRKQGGSRPGSGRPRPVKSRQKSNRQRTMPEKSNQQQINQTIAQEDLENGRNPPKNRKTGD